MDYKIVMDSAGDLMEMEGAEFSNVPLKILAGDREFVDDATTDVEEMVDYMSTYVGKSSTACPAPVNIWKPSATRRKCTA